MFNRTDKEEREYLKNLLKQVEIAIHFSNERIKSQSDEVQYLNTHLQEYKTDMDHLEKNAMGETVANYDFEPGHAFYETPDSKMKGAIGCIQYKGYVDFLNQAIEPAYPLLSRHMYGLDYGCGPVPN